MNDILDTIIWEGNSKAMYQAILKETPVLFRGMVKSKIQKWILQHDIMAVDENTVFQAVDDIAPRDLAESRIKPELEKLRSN